MLPSACVQVFPALRKTKSSPGIASNTVSTGTRESAHPRMALCGAWLYFAKAFSISPAASSLGSGSKSFIAILQHFQCHIWRHSFVCSRAHAMTHTRIIWSDHGRGNWQTAAEQVTLARRCSKEFYGAGLQLVDATFNLHLPWPHTLSDGVRIFQQEIDSVEHVHLDRMGCHIIWASAGPQPPVQLVQPQSQGLAANLPRPILPFAAKHSKHPWRSS